MNYPDSFQKLIDSFKKLPGIGSKSAERMAYHVLDMNHEHVHEFANNLEKVVSDLKYCKICGNITDDEVCDICQDSTRDYSTICVVESPKDVYAMEKVKEYKGMYHVLHGTISIIHGKTMDDLNINSLFERLNEQTKEVIIATNPTREGETTALYLAKMLEKKNINASRIANGLPIGSNLDYADELTLLKSLEGRKKI